MWLGKRNDQFVAMKQFPKLKQGKSVDQSAYIEFQIQELLLKYSNPNGKFKITNTPPFTHILLFRALKYLYASG